MKSRWIFPAVAACAFAQPPAFRADHAAGEALIRQGKLAAAIPYLERAQKADPSHYANSWDLALAYLETGRTAAAKQQIVAMLVRKDTAELHNLLGEAEERAGNPVEAAKQFQAAAEREPSEKHVGDWANHLVRYRAYEPAVKVYERGVEMYPKSSPLRVGLGVALYSLSKFDDAVRVLCEAVDLDPADPRPLEFLGSMIDVSPQLNGKVAERLAGYAGRFPENPLANFYYGVSLARSGEDSAAEKYLAAAVKLRPELAAAHVELAGLFERQKRDGEAMRELERVVGLEPRHESAHYRLGRLYQRSGQTVLAQKELAIHKQLQDQKRVGPRPATPALIVK